VLHECHITAILREAPECPRVSEVEFLVVALAPVLTTCCTCLAKIDWISAITIVVVIEDTRDATLAEKFTNIEVSIASLDIDLPGFYEFVHRLNPSCCRPHSRVA